MIARNNLHCVFCKSKSLERHIAKVIRNDVFDGTISSMGELRNLSDSDTDKIYNLDMDDPFSTVLSDLSNYVQSEHMEDVDPGTELEPGVFCQDVQSLTFDEESFDLVISVDLFEHVKHPEEAYREVYRVLKPGGFHVFTVPCEFGERTERRVRIEDGEVIPVKPEIYHYDSKGNPCLLMTDFGFDLLEQLEEIGYEVSVRMSDYRDLIKYGIADSHTFLTKKPENRNTGC